MFLGEDGTTPPDERSILRYELRPALKRLKLYFDGFGWHQFRRNSITWRQTVGGATSFEAGKGAGQTRATTTMHYSLVDTNREREQVTKMYDALIGPVEGQPQ